MKKHLFAAPVGRHSVSTHRLGAVARFLVAGVVVATLTTGTVAAATSRKDASPVIAPPTTSAPAAPVAEVAVEEPAPAPAPAPEPAPPATGPAYRVASADGGIFTHGWFGFAGSAAGVSKSPIVGLAHTASGDGYWVASADGSVYAFGDAEFHGAAVGVSAAPITGIAATPSRRGYWLSSADGGVFGFGDAGFFGGAADLGLSKRIVAIASTPTGAGYWLASSDGGVFAFGDAPFFGAVADQPTNARIVVLVPTPSGQGYHLAAADGGVFSFGDAVFHGGASDKKLARPITGMTLHPDDSGYWLLSGDGGVFSFGSAPFLGAPLAHGAKGSFVAISAGIGSHEPAPEPVAAPAPAPADIAVAAKGSGKPGKKNGKGGRLLDNEFGWDISYPQCGGSFPPGPMAYSIIGINGGRAFKHNKCLGEQWQWARSQGAAGVYVNVHAPRSQQELQAGATSDRQPNCNGAPGCVFYNFAVNGIRDSLAYARSQGVDAPFIWLDVEQLNYWAPQQELNAIVIRGAIDAVREAGLDVGIYSTPYQYGKITGDEQAQVPVWSAGAPNADAVGNYCATRGFAGGPVALVQLLPGRYDPNFACPGAGEMARYFNMP